MSRGSAEGGNHHTRLGGKSLGQRNKVLILQGKGITWGKAMALKRPCGQLDGGRGK